MMISFSTNKTDDKLIKRIADRAVAMAASNNIDYAIRDAEMDITAAHANGCQLRLKELLSSDEFNFAHDVFGIRLNLNRQTGKLENHFWPRYAV